MRDLLNRGHGQGQRRQAPDYVKWLLEEMPDDPILNVDPEAFDED